MSVNVHWLADEDFNNQIIGAVVRSHPPFDVVRVQDLGLSGAQDDVVLEWGANLGRIVLTHDAATLTACAYERVRAGLRMPGVVEVNSDAPIGASAAEIALIDQCSVPEELEGRVLYVPLR